ncbi:hypothetical protein DPM19_26140 [Actinomadura craniellae]|uniref:Uncharacterized protein n=1 Tax=Actinomadura craniellae TaxID=2231787 RepID=A0A365GZE0_9ACTN|nr:hypothetical protein [Actinomadura craniellae]RAY12205.1 hypothetical protein DPM19_26140 [Actinomadura craniellae]
MSDQGDFSARRRALEADTDEQQSSDLATGPIRQVGAVGEGPEEDPEPGTVTTYEPPDDDASADDEAGVVDSEPPNPAGRTEFSAPESPAASGAEPAWNSPAVEYEPVAEYDPVIAYEPDEAADVPVAGASARLRDDAGQGAESSTEGGEFDRSIFDSEGEGDPRYAPVSPSGTGPSTPPKPGTPSSGNWRMPEWMKDGEDGGSGESADLLDPYTEKRSRRGLVIGVGLLVVALLAAAAVYFLRPGSGSAAAVTPTPEAVPSPSRPAVQLPPEQPLQRFPGRPSPVLGRLTDPHSGLAYPRLGAPWQIPNKQNQLGQTGWSGQQIVVTERRRGGLWYGQLLTGLMGPAELSSTGYRGPHDLQTATALYARSIEAREYAFPHRTRPLASQALSVGGRQGWLVASYLNYQRPGVRATGEVMVVAVIDTGRAAPSVLFLSLPNTHRRLWPDINQFIAGLTPLR